MLNKKLQKKIRSVFNNQAAFNDYRNIKAVCLYFINGRSAGMNTLRDRFYFIYLLLFSFIYLRARRKNGKVMNMLYDPSNLPHQILARKTYLKTHLNKEVSQFHWRTEIAVHSVPDLLIFIKQYFSNLYLLRILFWPLKYNISAFAKYKLMCVIIEIEKPQELYVCNFMCLESLLITLTLTEKDMKLFYAPLAGSLLLLRYGNYKHINFIFSSKIQSAEFVFFKDIGWLKCANVSEFILGNQYCVNSKKDEQKKIHIGFFSQGFWAREKGLYRLESISELKCTPFFESDLNNLSNNILNNLVEYSKRKNVLLKIYLHPYEKQIYKALKILPPFFSIVDNVNVFSNLNESDYSNFFEPTVGVMLSSTTFYDRLNYDLPTYVLKYSSQYFSSDKIAYFSKKTFYISEHIKPYEDYFFSDNISLEKKIDKVLFPNEV